MKLEVGKFYKTRNGDKAECIAIWTREVYGKQATCVLGDNVVEDYCLDGKVFLNIKNSWDIIEEWREEG